ncbi:hypothetical protein CR513_61124, partial [Mucuna pruriens]
MPGQILRPAPNGINSKSFPRKSIVLSKNLSGKNSSGSFQAVGCNNENDKLNEKELKRAANHEHRFDVISSEICGKRTLLLELK